MLSNLFKASVLKLLTYPSLLKYEHKKPMRSQLIYTKKWFVKFAIIIYIQIVLLLMFIQIIIMFGDY